MRLFMAMNSSISKIPIYKKLDINSAEFIRPSNPLDIPCSDGTINSVHPGILKIDSGWNGYKYWMAHTPYKDSNTQLENPEIICSHDGINWVQPVGISNPITPPPNVPYHHSDTDLFLDTDGTMYCYFNFVDQDLIDSGGNEAHGVSVLWSTDGFNWISDIPASGSYLDNKRPKRMTPSTYVECFSPSIIREKQSNGSYLYVLYGMSDWITAENPMPPNYSTLIRWESTSPKERFTSVADCVMSNQPIQNGISLVGLWHLDINYEEGNGNYYAIFNYRDPAYSIYLGYSSDGKNWIFANNALFYRHTGNWDNRTVYRASIIINHGAIPTIDIWYSAQSNNEGEWYIGKGYATINYE